jgi:hypothetical protein
MKFQNAFVHVRLTKIKPLSSQPSEIARALDPVKLKPNGARTLLLPCL